MVQQMRRLEKQKGYWNYKESNIPRSAGGLGQLKS